MTFTFQNTVTHEQFKEEHIGEIVYHGEYEDVHAFSPEWKELPTIRNLVNSQNAVIVLVRKQNFTGESNSELTRFIDGNEVDML